MKIPFSYNLRNLGVRRTTTLMTALGVALTVAVLISALALFNGLRTAFTSSGHALNVLVIRKGSTSEFASNLNQETFRQMLYRPGIARRSEDGRPMASLEIVTVVTLPTEQGNSSNMSVTFRGLSSEGLDLRDLRLAAGRWFQPGRREIVMGKAIAARIPGARPGGRLRFGKSEWEVVGVMDGGSSVINSEILADLNQVSGDFNRADYLSSALLRVSDSAALSILINDLNNDSRLNVFAQKEKDYYDRQTAAGAPLQALGIFISLIMAVGSTFAAMNTMYAAVAKRTREIGTLRVLGFSRRQVLISFLIESVMLTLVGAVLGGLLTLPLNLVTTGIGNTATLSEVSINFRVSFWILLAAAGYASLIGAVSGYFPARAAARKDILTSLREV